MIDMEALLELAERLSAVDSDDPDRPRLWIGKSAGGIFVEFFGDPFDEPFHDLLEAVSTPSVAPHLTALHLRGPDTGANGTCSWGLGRLYRTRSGYPRLRSFTIEQGRPEDHNCQVLGDGFGDDLLGELFQKMPALELLVSPSPPEAQFFQTEASPLRHLSVNAAYDHQDFIQNLARAVNLPQLRVLEYGEHTGPGFEEVARTPFDAYAELLRSSSVRLTRLILRNPALSSAELQELRLVRPHLQLLVIRIESTYIC